MSSNGEYQFKVTKEFLEKVLKRKIKCFEIGQGSAPGDNFISVLHSLTIHYEGESEPAHYLLKNFPDLAARQALLTHTNIFMKEVEMYRTWVPELIKFQEELGSTNIIKPSFPIYIAGQYVDYEKEKEKVEKLVGELENYLILLNMKKNGRFEMSNKMIGLDYDSARLAIEEMAKFHALGWTYQQKNDMTDPFVFKKKYPFFEDNFWHGQGQKLLRGLIIANYQLGLDIASRVFGPNSEIYKGGLKLKEGISELFFAGYYGPDGEVDEERIEKVMRINPGKAKEFLQDKWIVPLHGDFWLNNILYSKNEKTGKPSKVLLLDLQLSRMGCPTVELSYFMHTTVDYETRKNHLDDLLKAYHDTFLKICAQYNVQPLPGFNFQGLKDRFNRTRIYGLIAGCMCLPVMLSDEQTNKDTLVKKDGKENVSEFFKEISNTMNTADGPLSKRISEIFKEAYEQGSI